MSVVLEHFRRVIVNTAEDWPYCSSVRQSDMLRVWFSCPFVSSVVAALEVCANDEQH
jgi:hypothetical protein